MIANNPPSTMSSSEKVAVVDHVNDMSAVTPSTTHGNYVMGDKIHDIENDDSDVDWSGIDAAKVLRKMDLHVIPMVTILYLLNFLDRGNIGNAKIQGMPADLKLTGPQFNMCLTVFYFTYGAFEVPSNMLLKKFTPSIWLPTIMVAWGICTVCMGVVKNYHGLLVVRLLLGVFEAGLFPGVCYYLTLWFRAEEMAFRQGFFFSAASLAGAFSGLLAYAIVKMDGVGGYAGWRWIFILEGLLTIVVATSSYFLMYDSPEKATFLTVEERAWAVNRLKHHGSKNSSRLVEEVETSEFKWEYVKAALSDWQVYVAIAMYWGLICPLYGISLFLPTIIHELGYVATTAQLLTIPIYATACLGTIGICLLSDRAAKRGGKRSPWVFFPMIAVLVGFVMALAASASGKAPGVVYAGVFIAYCGMTPAFPLHITWISNNISPSYKRAVAMAMHIGVGNFGGAFASNFYRTADSPKFLLGHALEIGFTSMGLCAVVVMRLTYMRINKKRAASDAGDGMSEEELSRLGDKAPTFVYLL